MTEKIMESAATKSLAKNKKKSMIDIEYVSDTPALNSIKSTESLPTFNWPMELTTNEIWSYNINVFTPKECKQIIQIGEFGIDSSPITYGITGNNPVGVDLNELAKVRRSPISWIRSDKENNRWIFERLTNHILATNKQYYNYDLADIQSLQFTCYDAKEKGFYDKHVDMMYQGVGTRKLSVTIQLSDGEDYEGGNLLLHHKANPDIAPRDQGTAVFFPSWMLHEVTPVTKGKRYSLVAWVLGPKFK